jgi:hypothetical protein
MSNEEGATLIFMLTLTVLRIRFIFTRRCKGAVEDFFAYFFAFSTFVT